MSPEDYEHHVAAVLRTEGWATTVTRLSRDLGVDIVAERAGSRMAVQAKMYGASSTKVNAEQVMCLYGAAAYADCTERMLATDGRFTSEAQVVATKLDVEVRSFRVDAVASSAFPPAPATDSFRAIWRNHVEPLAGTEIKRDDGKVMRILEVDGSGVRRITTGGTKQRIGIDTFRWAIDCVLAGESVTRKQIHERNPRQVSSGVMLILGRVPLFELVTVGRLTAIRMRPSLPSPRE